MISPRLSLGEFAISWRGEDFLFSPSFLAMSRIGTPTEIVETLHLLCGGIHDRIAYSAALKVLQACCDRELPPNMVGGYAYSDRRGKTLLHKGDMEFDDAITLASHLMINGIVGKPGGRVKKDARPLTEWDATEWQGAAVGMLGASPTEAWRMTMIEFQSAVDAKYPDTKAANIPTKEEYDAVMGAADAAIKRAEAKRNG